MFKAVKGQNIAVKMLSQELAGGLLPQTLLFHGPDGTGKFLTAIELAKLLNCENPGSEPTGENAGSGCCCVSCRAHAQHRLCCGGCV